MKRVRIAALALCSLFLLVSMAGAVVADGEVEGGGITGPMLHGISMTVGLLAVVIMIAATREIGGKLGSGFKALTLGIVFITMGFTGYMIYELQHIEAIELISEVFLIAGIIAVMVGTKKFVALAK
ncbi:MAG: hypothetical protein ACE5OT_03815 [Candidatus Hadarchaeaceae archaeon]